MFSLMNLTRNEIAAELYRHSNITLGQCRFALDTILSIIADALVEGHKLELRGFGTLRVMSRKARIGRNPKQPKAGA